MNLIHLELQADHLEPNWNEMMTRLAPNPDQDQRPNVIMVRTEDGGIYDRGRLQTMVRYLESAWQGHVEDGFRETVAGTECLFVPDFSDEECGKAKSTRLSSTVRWFLEDIPWLLECGGFTVA